MYDDPETFRQESFQQFQGTFAYTRAAVFSANPTGQQAWASSFGGVKKVEPVKPNLFVFPHVHWQRLY